MLTTADFRNGLTIEVDGEPYLIVEFQHVKPGKGPAFVRTRLKHVKTGRVLEKTFDAGERVEPARIERRPMQYLYTAGESAAFMDLETFDTVEVDLQLLGTGAKYLREGMECSATLHDGNLISIEVPWFVEMAVIQTDPGIRGDTASGGTKPAVLETGATVQVPLFIETGDILKVDTRTDTYIERVSQMEGKRQK